MHKNLHNLKVFKIVSFSIVISFLFCIMFISSSSMAISILIFFIIKTSDTVMLHLYFIPFYSYILHLF